jgi:signal transduction histidine kinase
MQETTSATSVSESAERAHEQKNCLSIILAVASLVTPELNGPSRARMERLRAAAHRIRDLLSEELDESGDDGTRDVDVERLFGRVCESLCDRAEAARVALVVDCGGGHVRGVEAELREALFNLIANAVEATPAHGAVYIRAESTLDGEQVWSIHDSGKGMKSEVLEELHAGRLGQRPRSFRPGGSGLGVALSRAIVHRNGGSMAFDVVPGRGTTITIRFPPASSSP